MPIAPAVAFNSLQNTPVTYLKTYPTRIFGATAASGVCNYGLGNRGNSHRPGTVLGTNNMHDTESFNIRSTASGLVDGGDQVFNAHSIHMDVGAAALGFYLLPSVGGPDIMVTGQLSGCAFVISPVAGGNNLNVAHVQPQAVNSTTLRNNLAAAHPNGFVYGASDRRGYYDGATRAVSIVGIRAAGSWTLYAQKQDRASGDYSIKSVWEIYPRHRKV